MNSPEPPIIKSDNAIRTHWKRFITLWMIPVALIGAFLLKDLAGSNVLLIIGLAAVFVLFLSVVPLILLPYLRGKILFWHVMALGAPVFGIWIVLVVVRAIILTLLGKPL